jgi:hypothetical protein
VVVVVQLHRKPLEEELEANHSSASTYSWFTWLWVFLPGLAGDGHELLGQRSPTQVFDTVVPYGA